MSTTLFGYLGAWLYSRQQVQFLIFWRLVNGFTYLLKTIMAIGMGQSPEPYTLYGSGSGMGHIINSMGSSPSPCIVLSKYVNPFIKRQKSKIEPAVAT